MMTTLPLEQPAARKLDWPALLGKLGPLIGLVFVFVLFTVLANIIPGASRFATLNNMQLMMRQTSVVGIAALGMTLIIISGGIDLSVGSNIALATIIIALVMNATHGQNGILPALSGIAMAAFVGFVIGMIITGLRLAPFIVTLGMWGSVRGV